MKNAIKTGFGIYIGFKLCEKLINFGTQRFWLAILRWSKKHNPELYKLAVDKKRAEDEDILEAVFEAYPDLAI